MIAICHLLLLDNAVFVWHLAFYMCKMPLRSCTHGQTLAASLRHTLSRSPVAPDALRRSDPARSIKFRTPLLFWSVVAFSPEIFNVNTEWLRDDLNKGAITMLLITAGNATSTKRMWKNGAFGETLYAL